MGNWQLEVFKLALYVSFPVGMFYFYNQADLFEDWVVKMKRDLYPPEKLSPKQEIQDCIAELRHKHQAQMIAKMQEELVQQEQGRT